MVSWSSQHESCPNGPEEALQHQSRSTRSAESANKCARGNSIREYTPAVSKEFEAPDDAAQGESPAAQHQLGAGTSHLSRSNDRQPLVIQENYYPLVNCIPCHYYDQTGSTTFHLCSLSILCLPFGRNPLELKMHNSPNLGIGKQVLKWKMGRLGHPEFDDRKQGIFRQWTPDGNPTVTTLAPGFSFIKPLALLKQFMRRHRA
jgi:hypothetical protein